MDANQTLTIIEVSVDKLVEFPGNPRLRTEKTTADLTESLKRFGVVDPLIIDQNFRILGGNYRASILKKLGYKTVPCVQLNIKSEAKARELLLRLNKNVSTWDNDLLGKLDEALLADVGFTKDELKELFDVETEPQPWDLQKELTKLNIEKIKAQKGDVYKVGPDIQLMVGDSTVEADMLKLMGGEKADMCMTDEPYVLDYLNGKRHGSPTVGFGAKKNRRYLETDSLPDNFVQLWTGCIAKIAKPDFSVIAFENWKNLRLLWNELERHWTIRNLIIWRLPNRHAGYAAKHRFFNKYDIAMVGSSGDVNLNLKPETNLLQQEYESALFATSGDPFWQGYQKGKRTQPTDFIQYEAADEKSSGQSIIFGVKPPEILIPYLKVLTQRGDLVVDPFCGSGSTAVSCAMLKRRCYTMEKSNVYAEVALRRLEMETGFKREKIS